METIKKVIEKYKLKRITKYLCDCLKVSTSGYYSYLNNKEKRRERNEQDKKDYELILKAYKYRNRKKGARQIKLLLQNKFGVNFNLKKIRRLMKKYGLKCPIRKANPYRRMVKATKEHSICENKVNRKFKTGIPYNVLLTDITYLFYGNKRKCYLSTIKDAITGEVLVENAVTNEKGEYIIENVPYGRYVFTEIQAPEGYEIEEGSVGAVFDVKSPETIFEIVNTGDIALVATVCIALISILGITYIVIRNKQQKQV